MGRLWHIVYKLASRVRETAWKRGQLWKHENQTTYDFTYMTEPAATNTTTTPEWTGTASWSVDPYSFVWDGDSVVWDGDSDD